VATDLGSFFFLEEFLECSDSLLTLVSIFLFEFERARFFLPLGFLAAAFFSFG